MKLSMLLTAVTAQIEIDHDASEFMHVPDGPVAGLDVASPLDLHHGKHFDYDSENGTFKAVLDPDHKHPHKHTTHIGPDLSHFQNHHNHEDPHHDPANGGELHMHKHQHEDPVATLDDSANAEHANAVGTPYSTCWFYMWFSCPWYDTRYAYTGWYWGNYGPFYQYVNKADGLHSGPIVPGTHQTVWI